MSGSLGLNYNTNDQSAQATSNAYGYSGSQSGDTSRSSSEGISGGQSASVGGSTARSGQSIAFEDLYKQLYGSATNAANNVAMQAPQLQDAAKMLFTGGSNFLQSLGGNAGSDYQTNRLNGSNSAVDDIIASMKTDAASLFTDKLNPAITANAVAGGTLGGGRQGVAQGVAQAQVANDFTRNAAGVRLADVNAKDAIAQNVAQNSIAAANTGLGALPGMLDIVERGQNAELAPYSSLAGILGGPTTLASSMSDSFSNANSSEFARNTAQTAADAFSRSFGEQTAESQSTSKGKSRGYGYSGSFSYGGMGGSS
jgi:hypothetical protein